jgi:transcriptional repressor NrdR
MRCPECDSVKTKISDSRKRPDRSVKRRRFCLDCGHRFITEEVYQMEGEYLKKKRADLRRARAKLVSASNTIRDLMTEFVGE